MKFDGLIVFHFFSLPCADALVRKYLIVSLYFFPVTGFVKERKKNNRHASLQG